MNAIESMDWGAYSHFTFQARFVPHLIAGLYDLYQYVMLVPALLLLAAIILFARARQVRKLLIAIISFMAAFGLILATHHLIPRRRPPDAQRWLGADHMLGSYPSGEVLLCILAAILLGLALWPMLTRRWQRAVYVLFATLTVVAVCMSQLLLSLNFVTDLIGGIVGGALIGLIASRVMKPSAGPDFQLQLSHEPRQ